MKILIEKPIHRSNGHVNGLQLCKVDNHVYAKIGEQEVIVTKEILIDALKDMTK